MHLRATTLIAVLLAVCLSACGGGGPGERLYREGRFAEAHQAFRAAAEAAGEGASAELSYHHALSAYRAGDITDAEAAAGRAAEVGDASIATLATFLRGNCRFARCLTAAIQADTPEAEPFAFDVAIRYGEAARDLFASAAASREDWPEARRNLERALIEIDRLARRKAEAEARREPPPAPEPPPVPEPPPPPAPEDQTTEEEIDAAAQMKELSPEKVLGLLEMLAEKEREKLAGRRERLTTAGEGVERGW